MPGSIFEALREHRDVSQLVRALPRALQPLLEFDYMSLFLEQEIAGGAVWYVPPGGDPAARDVRATGASLSRRQCQPAVTR